MGTVFPGFFQRAPDSAIAGLLEPLLAQGRPGHVSAELLKSAPVTAIDRSAGVDIDVAYLGDRCGPGLLDAHRTEGLLGAAARFVAQELDIAR